MIDEKKIEAKEEIYEDRFLLNGEEIVFNNDEKEEMFYGGDIKEAIGLGAKRAIILDFGLEAAERCSIDAIELLTDFIESNPVAHTLSNMYIYNQAS